MMSSLTLVLVDSRSLIRDAVAAALVDAGLDVVAAVSDRAAALLQVERLRPQVVVVSADTPEAFTRLVPDLRALDQRPKILVLDAATVAEDDALMRAIEAGADGYTTGRAGLSGLADAIRTLATGGAVVPPEMLGPLLRKLVDQRRETAASVERLMQLTPREREIMLMMARGLDHTEIAAQLVISTETARTHVHRVLRKLDVGSRLEALVLVREHGLIDHLERVVLRSAS